MFICINLSASQAEINYTRE